MQQAGSGKLEMIARIFADTGVKDLFAGIFHLILKYQDKPRVIRLRGKYVSIDPREWKNNYDVTVNVGLGTGSQDQKMAMAAKNALKQLGGLFGKYLNKVEDQEISEAPKENLEERLESLPETLKSVKNLEELKTFRKLVYSKSVSHEIQAIYEEKFRELKSLAAKCILVHRFLFFSKLNSKSPEVIPIKQPLPDSSMVSEFISHEHVETKKLNWFQRVIKAIFNL